MEIHEMMLKAIEFSMKAAMIMAGLENGMTVKEAEMEIAKIDCDNNTMEIPMPILEKIVARVPLEEWHMHEPNEDGTTDLSMEFYFMDWIAEGRVENGKVVSVDSETIEAPPFMELLMRDLERSRLRRNK